jgi:hypothetical protein
VYYLQGRYEKALEGYRKAEQLLPTDAVGQYNLAQAYIKTLLMAESSDALRASAAAGIDRVKDSYAKPAQPGLLVYAKTYQPRDLWRIAGVEGTSLPPTLIDDVLAPVTRFDGRTGAWIMLATLIIVLILAHFIKRQHLAFQCSNCGELTSEATANSERGMYICRDCAGVIAVQLWSRGYVIKDWYMLELPTPVWKWALPAAGIVIAYAMTLLSRQYKEVRNYRNTSLRARSAARETSTARRASA